MTPIAAAVQPLKTDAQRWAATVAREEIARMTAQLEAAGWDLNKVAPYPRAANVSREEYRTKKARYDRFSSVTRSLQPSHRLGEPVIVRLDENLVARFVQNHVDAVGAGYDAFVAKLEAKVGEHTGAILTGNHVWGWSFLSVETPAGAQVWKTRQITNTSKLGLRFPQWPSRRVKSVGA